MARTFYRKEIERVDTGVKSGLTSTKELFIWPASTSALVVNVFYGAV